MTDKIGQTPSSIMMSSSFCQTGQLIVGHISSNRSKNLALMFEPCLFMTRSVILTPGIVATAKTNISFTVHVVLGWTGCAPVVREGILTTCESKITASSDFAETNA